MIILVARQGDSSHSQQRWGTHCLFTSRSDSPLRVNQSDTANIALAGQKQLGWIPKVNGSTLESAVANSGGAWSSHPPFSEEEGFSCLSAELGSVF